MPKAGNLIGWTVSTLVMVAVGIFILSRTPVWGMLVRK